MNVSSIESIARNPYAQAIGAAAAMTLALTGCSSDKVKAGTPETALQQDQATPNPFDTSTAPSAPTTTAAAEKLVDYSQVVFNNNFSKDPNSQIPAENNNIQSYSLKFDLARAGCKVTPGNQLDQVTWAAVRSIQQGQNVKNAFAPNAPFTFGSFSYAALQNVIASGKKDCGAFNAVSAGKNTLDPAAAEAADQASTAPAFRP